MWPCDLSQSKTCAKPNCCPSVPASGKASAKGASSQSVLGGKGGQWGPSGWCPQRQRKLLACSTWIPKASGVFWQLRLVGMLIILRGKWCGELRTHEISKHSKYAFWRMYFEPIRMHEYIIHTVNGLDVVIRILNNIKTKTWNDFSSVLDQPWTNQLPLWFDLIQFEYGSIDQEILPLHERHE